MSKEAMKLALEALEDRGELSANEFKEKKNDAITAIKEALSQPESCKYGQEPKSCTSSPMDCQCVIDATLAQPAQELVCVCGAVWEGQELVLTPPQRKPLTEYEIDCIRFGITAAHHTEHAIKLTRAIEAAHGIKE